jgi:hypothetical protein
LQRRRNNTGKEDTFLPTVRELFADHPSVIETLEAERKQLRDRLAAVEAQLAIEHLGEVADGDDLFRQDDHYAG